MTTDFEILPHTADVGVAARGKNLREAFANAAVGLFTVITDLDPVQEREEREVKVSASDWESLLVNWLNELIFLFDVENLLLRRFSILDLEETHLRAHCFGERVDRSRHTVKIGVKAATYHQVKVERGPECRVQVYLDI